MIVVALNKAYNRKQRKALRLMLEMKGTHIKYIYVMKDMYDGAITSVKMAKRDIEELSWIYTRNLACAPICLPLLWMSELTCPGFK